MEAFNARGAQLFAISSDTPEDSRAFALKKGLTFPLLSDADLHVIRAYGVENEGKDIAIPATVIVDSSAKVTWVYVGDRAGDRPYVPAVLEALGTSTSTNTAVTSSR